MNDTYIYTNDLDILDVSNIKMIYFCHIPKTSGSSLEPSRMIKNNNCKWTRDNKKQIEYFNLGHKFHVKNSYNLPSHKGGHIHMPFEYFEIYQDSYNVEPNFKFSIIRNPFDLLCSYYHHIEYNGKQEGWGSINKILNIKSFDEFIIKYCDDTTQWPQPLLKKNLYSQLFNEDNKCMVDLIIKFENRNECLKLLMNKFNLDFLDISKHERNRKINNYKSYYTPELIKLVEKKCKFELNTFNYNFNGDIDNNYFIINKESKLIKKAN